MADTAARRARTIELLWSVRDGDAGSHGLPALVEAALLLADAEGIGAVSMRRIAHATGTPTMTLYGRVPDKEALLALLVDRALIGMAVTEPPFGTGWRDRLRLVARDNRALILAHPWLLGRLEDPPPGPGRLAKYEWELSAFRGLGLSASETESCLTLLLGVVRAAVAEELAVLVIGGSAGQETAPLASVLARRVDPEEFPLASRIGAEAAAVQRRRFRPDHAFEFGLERTLDGIAALVARG